MSCAGAEGDADAAAAGQEEGVRDGRLSSKSEGRDAQEALAERRRDSFADAVLLGRDELLAAEGEPIERPHRDARAVLLLGERELAVEERVERGRVGRCLLLRASAGVSDDAR